MPSIGFREKQYETAANIELGHYHRAVFAPDQVIEAVLGYDVAANQPKNAPIWKILDLKARTGLFLNTNLWQKAKRKPKAADLPSEYVSLIFQYKCPEQITRPNGRQWRFWNENYFRFEVYPHQHAILKKLETNTGNRAVVRYASPAFSTYRTLQDHQLQIKVLTHSAFASPNQIGRHLVWTYTSAGTKGRGNPDGDENRLDTFDEVWAQVIRFAKRENLLEHLRGLSEGVVSSAIFFVRDLDGLLDVLGENLSVEHRIGLLDAFNISNSIAEAEATWFIVDLGEE